jgi:release factor glutamine methyltransferase
MVGRQGVTRLGRELERLGARLQGRSTTPGLDAQLLLANILQESRSWVLAHPEYCLEKQSAAALERSVSQLEKGVPLPYILGQWEFFSLNFKLTPDVLIPRPETEQLVAMALSWLASHPHARQALDVGTGSGCIAITLAVHVPDLQLSATDISPQALEVAASNALRHGVSDRVKFSHSDLLPTGGAIFPLILANLPYIPTRTLHELPLFGKEPSLALDGGGDGLELIRRLLLGAPAVLAPAGCLLIEIEAGQGRSAGSMARNSFPSAVIKLHQDLAGHDRLLEVRLEGEIS